MKKIIPKALLEEAKKKARASRPSEDKWAFDAKHITADLKGRSIRGGAVTIMSQAVIFILRMGSTIVLARLLTPNDYGLVAMVTAITGFVALFKNMGLSFATIQRNDITHSLISNLFWLNVAVSVILAMIVAACAPLISHLYGEPRLTWITIILAIAFIFSGFTVQHRALLHKNLRFMAIAVTEIGALSIGIIIGIVMAWYGAEYWALVGLSGGIALSSMALVWLVCDWRPGCPVRGTGIMPILKFGGHITGFDMLNYLARNLDNILIGRFWGANVLGLYSKAYNIMMLPIHQIREPLNAVALPVLSHLQNDQTRYRRYYMNLITLIAFITMPLMTFLFVYADQVILMVLGDQWLGAVNIFKILCLNAFIHPVSTTWGLVLISLGQSKRYLSWGIINSSCIVVSFLLGLPWGGIGVATAYTLVSYFLIVPTFWFCFRKTPITIGSFMSAVIRPIIASLCMGLLVYAFRSNTSHASEIISMGCSVVIGFSTYLITLILLPGGLSVLVNIFSMRTSLFSGGD